MRKTFSRTPRRAVLTFLVFMCSGCLNAMSASQVDPFPKAKRILVLGDSIAYQGNYVEDVEAWFVTRFPDSPKEWINAALPSEAVSGLSEQEHLTKFGFKRPDLRDRLDRALTEIKPELVVACYGMNDGIFLPFDSERFLKYQEGILWLKSKCREAGTQVLFLTPPVYDEEKGDKKGYANTLDEYSKWLISKRAEGWWVIDIHGAMKEALDLSRKENPAFFYAKDGIHPDEKGHWTIARCFLQSLGAKDLEGVNSPEEMVANISRGKEILEKIQQRQRFMKDAWLTSIKHHRPGMKKGIPIEVAKEKYAETQSQIYVIQGRKAS